MTEPTGSLRAALEEAVEVLEHVAHDGTDFDISVSTAIERGKSALAQPAPPTEATEARAREVLAKHLEAGGFAALAKSARGSGLDSMVAAMLAFSKECTPPHDGLPPLTPEEAREVGRIEGLEEAIKRAINEFVSTQDDGALMLPFIQFFSNRDDLLVEAIASAVIRTLANGEPA